MHNYNILNRFHTKTRVGNWYEEAELNDFKFKEYLYNKNEGKNQTLNTKTKLSFSNQIKELSPYNEGKICWGDYVSLGNDLTQAVLAFNVNQELSGQDAYAVTTSKDLKPSLRNVFQIVPTSEAEGSTLKYGDKFRIQTLVGEKKLYLQAIAVSPMRSSKFSRFPQVSVTADINSGSIWIAQHFDGKLRFDALGCEVQAGDQVLFKHCLTAQWLASDKVTYVNNFGSEFQVFAKSMLTNNKTQNLFSEKVGHKSVQNPLRNQDTRNSWRILKGQ